MKWPLVRDVPWLRVVALGAAAVWAWFASGVRTFTQPAEVLTFLPVLAVLLMTVRPSARIERAALDSKDLKGLRGVLFWAFGGVLLISWELAELFSQPRSAHPTLSSLTNTLLSTHPSRFVGYLAWLLLGWMLVRDLGGSRRAR